MSLIGASHIKKESYFPKDRIISLLIMVQTDQKPSRFFLCELNTFIILHWLSEWRRASDWLAVWCKTFDWPIDYGQVLIQLKQKPTGNLYKALYCVSAL